MTSNGSLPGAPPNLVLALTGQIAAAFLSSRATAASDVPGIVLNIRQALESLGGNGPRSAVNASVMEKAPKPSSLAIRKVDPKRSVFPGHIVCMECNKSFKTIRRHLRTSHATTPDQYRTKFRLPDTYPLTAPQYAAARSVLAKDMGLGKRGRHAR